MNSPLGNIILRVNHAGENGAVHIYAGQIATARFFAPHLLSTLKDFKSHEENHRRIFEAQLTKRNVSRCLSFHMCALGGYVLGFITGLCGEQAIAATTVAVEKVVLTHLEKQIKALEGIDSEAVKAIQEIIDDERHHHNKAAEYLRPQHWWNKILYPVVSGSTEAVIWIGMRS